MIEPIQTQVPPLRLTYTPCDCSPETMGTYSHHVSVETPWGQIVSVDACMVPELASLWRLGIRTVASCCGHRKGPGFVAAHEADAARLDALGYRRCPDAEHCHIAQTAPAPLDLLREDRPL